MFRMAFILIFSCAASTVCAQQKDEIRKSIFFGGGSYEIDEFQGTELYQWLDSVPDLLEKYNIQLISHTDPIGGKEFNEWLSKMRSEAVQYLLIQKDILNQNTLLILDEPEVHLHPTWQVKFAEILVLLSKEFAIPIVLTSHSPYFIEALEAYTKKYKYENSTNFYFAKKNEGGLSSKIIDVTEDIMPILNSISEAFYTIQDLNDED